MKHISTKECIFILIGFSFSIFFLEQPPLAPNNIAVKPFPSVVTQAQSVYIYDVATNTVLYEKDSQKIRPLASLTKLMTALVAQTDLPNKKVITVTSESLKMHGDDGLYANEQWRAKDLIDFMLTSSSNDAAAAVASAFIGTASSFIDRMNQEAFAIGLRDSHFNNPTGLDENIDGGLGTARDIGQLFSYIIKKYPSLVEATEYKNYDVESLSHKKHLVKNTDEALPNIPALIGSKTGYTDKAQGNLVFAFDAGIQHPIVIALLGSSIEGRFTDAQLLTKAVLNYLGQ